jgi:hypothetical protein
VRKHARTNTCTDTKRAGLGGRSCLGNFKALGGDLAEAAAREPAAAAAAAAATTSTERNEPGELMRTVA